MIKKYMISKDKKYYRAFTDLMLLNDILYCTFCEMNKETNESNICISVSKDRGKTWSDRKIISHKLSDEGRWDGTKLCKLENKIILLSTWYLNNDETKKNSYVYMWYYDNNFNYINGPIKTSINGIVPDKIIELDDRWVVSTHEKNNSKRETYIFTSFDNGKNWNKKILAKSDVYDLCETSIVKIDNNTLVALMRENSHQGIDCLKVISYDKGETWSDIYKMPIPACHRPIISELNEDKYLITYRFDYANFKGKGNHGNMFLGCICTKQDLLEKNRDNIVLKIFPIDYDRNINSNCGYSGQIQFDDGLIYVSAHIVDDNPVAQIRGYSFYLSDIFIDQ